MPKHFISLNDFTLNELYQLLDRAEYLSHQSTPIDILRNKIISLAFFEPSTRTRTSFEMATIKLGGKVIHLNEEQSSLKKQESLEDTLLTLQAIGVDAIVLRHKDDRAAEAIASKLHIPLINAGAGKQEHPSQCLLDLLTIKMEFGRFENLKITLVGDIKHSRVASSFIQIAPKLGMHLNFIAPPDLIHPHFPTSHWDQVRDSHVVMCLRYQLERMEDAIDLMSLTSDYQLTESRFQKFSPHCIIMHPAPINHDIEIQSGLVHHQRSRIFKQMQLGVFARMSLLEYLFSSKELK